MTDAMRDGMNRREFITATTVAGVCALCAFGGLSTARADDPPAPRDIGGKADYSKDGFTTTWETTDHVIIARENGKLYAMTSVCTHKGFDVVVAGDHLTCPQHHSNYSADGKVTKGPARKSLVRFAISTNADGKIIVDQSQTFDDQHWDDPKSFIAMDAAK